MDASVPSPVHTRKGHALQKVTLLHYQTQVFMIQLQVQTSVLKGYNRGDLKQCSSVQSSFFPPKKRGENRKVPKTAKICCSNAEFIDMIFFVNLVQFYHLLLSTYLFYPPNSPENYQFPPKKVLFSHRNSMTDNKLLFIKKILL